MGFSASKIMASKTTVALIASLIMGFSSIVEAAVLQNGGHRNGTISVAGELDEHTFYADAGDTVFLSLADYETTEFLNAPLYPRLRLLNSSDVEVTSASGALVADFNLRITTSGTYTVQISDYYNNNTGSYRVYYTRTPGADENEGGTLINGGHISDTIDLGDIDSYTFVADAGDHVIAHFADTETSEFVSAPFYPRLFLIDPMGETEASASGPLVAGIDTRLTISGTYTLVLKDYYGDYTGSYDLHFALVPSADENEGGTLRNGDIVEDDIDLGDIDTYTINAQAGDYLMLRAVDLETTEFVPAPFYPRLVVYDPNGEQFGSGSGSLVATVAKRATISGAYTVVLTDYYDTRIGAYAIHYTKSPGANEGAGISGGQTINGAIDLGDIDSWSFNATPGGLVRFSAMETIGDFYPRLLVIGPDGLIAAQRSDPADAILEWTPVSTGPYTLLLFDYYGTGVSDYTLTALGAISGIGSKLCAGLPVTVDLGLGQSPTSGNDVIRGTSGNDVINALGGNDTICAKGGDDTINAGSGNDTVMADGGHDTVNGGTGADTIYGGSGDDILNGDGGGDYISGQVGSDLIDGGAGVDDLRGGPSADTIYTGSGATVGTGKYTSGGAGADMIFGGESADDIRGVGGSDIIYGYGGDDVITGGVGQDVLYGGDGDDDIKGQQSPDEIYGESGNDVLSGGKGGDTIEGGTGNDVLKGNAGNDTLKGQSGDDTLQGGEDNDSLSGAGGTDSCNGNGGTDSAVGCESTIQVP